MHAAEPDHITVTTLLVRQAALYPNHRVDKLNARELHDEFRIYDYGFACLLCGWCTAEARKTEATDDVIDKWTELWIRLIEEHKKGR